MDTDVKQLIAELFDTVLSEPNKNYDKCYKAARALETQAKQIEELTASVESLEFKISSVKAERDENMRIARASIEELAAALAVKDEDGYRGYVTEALAPQPHASLVAKIKADAVRRGLAEWEITTEPIYSFMQSYADRIEQEDEK